MQIADECYVELILINQFSNMNEHEIQKSIYSGLEYKDLVNCIFTKFHFVRSYYRDIVFLKSDISS